jgi:hypothetical protein
LSREEWEITEAATSASDHVDVLEKMAPGIGDPPHETDNRLIAEMPALEAITAALENLADGQTNRLKFAPLSPGAGPWKRTNLTI